MYRVIELFINEVPQQIIVAKLLASKQADQKKIRSNQSAYAEN